MPTAARSLSSLTSTNRQGRVVARPKEGWLRTVREAQGLSRRTVGEKLGVTHAAVRDYELAEIRDAITLATLRRTAGALGCDLVVALVPKDKRSFAASASTRAEAVRPPPDIHDAMKPGEESGELASHLK